MPVYNPKPDAPPAEKPTTPQIAKPQYRGVTVDTQYVPQSSLLTNIEGSSWTVQYYSQVVDKDNALSGQQLSLDPTDQQYRVIYGMEMKVQNALTTTQDQDTKSMIVTGTAVTYPFLVPLEGDMFLADIGDGREAVFRITSTERRTYFKESCFQIEYELVDYSTDERRGDLNRKTVQELYFLKDFLLHGQGPLLFKQDFADVQMLTEKYFEILNVYFKMFASNEYKTLIVPGQGSNMVTYDHFLMKAVTALFNTQQAPEMVQMRVMNVDDNETLKCFTLWDALLLRQPDLMPFLNRKIGLINTVCFTERPQLEGIRYSGIKYVVYPTDPDVCVNYEIRPPAQPASAGMQLKPVPSRPGLLESLIANKVTTALPYQDAPLIKDVLADNYYVFSQAFYENGQGQSKLELLVRDYLNNKAIDRRTLVLLTQTYQAWGGLERFYYVPIVLLLIRAAIRTI